MILLASIGLGLALGFLSGGTLGGLAGTRLRGESTLVALVLATALLPRLFDQAPARWHPALLAVWAVGIGVLVWLSWLNLRTPGIGVLGAGLTSNAAVILANGGMPVDLRGAGDTAAALSERLAASAFHVAAGPSTRLPILGDVMPLPGLGLLVSVGDVLMLVGVVAFIVWAMRHGDAGGLAVEAD